MATDAPDAVAERFGALRPLIESGWEMPLMVHALLAGVEARALEESPRLAGGGPAAHEDRRGTAEMLGRALNRVRDDWFARDARRLARPSPLLPGRPCPPGALLDGPTRVVIVTTKTERFARALLIGADPRLSAVSVVGREPGQPVPKPAS